jgi:hypothetical protein
MIGLLMACMLLVHVGVMAMMVDLWAIASPHECAVAGVSVEEF